MADLPVNVVDIAVGVVLLLSALLAYGRGFVHEVLSVGGWIGAIFATVYGYPHVRPYAHELISVELVADLAAGSGIFVLSLVVLSLLTRAIAKGVQSSALNALDRSLGFLFGILRGAVIVCLLYIGVEWMLPPEDQPEWLTEARAMPVVRQGSAFLLTLLPAQATENGATAADDAAEQAKKLMDSGKILKEMLNVEPKGGASVPMPGYDKKTRSGMEQLIETNQ